MDIALMVSIIAVILSVVGIILVDHKVERTRQDIARTTELILNTIANSAPDPEVVTRALKVAKESGTWDSDMKVERDTTTGKYHVAYYKTLRDKIGVG